MKNMQMRLRRKDEATRRKYRQTKELTCADLVMPLFIKEGIPEKREISSMPGIYQFPLQEAVDQARKIYDLGIPLVILFGIPLRKDDTGASAYDPNGIIQEAIRRIKKAVPCLKVIADVCLCEYTMHGHCGVLKNPPVPPFKKGGLGGIVDNALTIKILAKIALSYAQAGADIVAPSAMMDFQVKVIKEALVKNDYAKVNPVRNGAPRRGISNGVKILAYSAKYASSFYGPFRDAAESVPKFGDRKTYQMDYYNSDEAVLEAKLDIQEGADMLMVKPALGYQDIIYRIKNEILRPLRDAQSPQDDGSKKTLIRQFPLACYSVSGEYAMIKAAAFQGYLDEKKIVLETLTGFKRAGADLIITYYAQNVAKWLK